MIHNCRADLLHFAGTDEIPWMRRPTPADDRSHRLHARCIGKLLKLLEILRGSPLGKKVEVD
jgi:hypothetical protein